MKIENFTFFAQKINHDDTQAPVLQTENLS